jgi:hypothetical protein
MSLVVLASSTAAAEEAAEALCRKGFRARAGDLGGASFVIVNDQDIDPETAVGHVRDTDPGSRLVKAW